jgi:hypothetical protein
MKSAEMEAAVRRLVRGFLRERPPAPHPRVPEGWTLLWDRVGPPESLQQVSARLGARVAALRNSIYGVAGSRVISNVYVFAAEADAQKFEAGLAARGGKDRLVRRGAAVYEFSGGEEVLPQIRAARALLEGG